MSALTDALTAVGKDADAVAAAQQAAAVLEAAQAQLSKDVATLMNLIVTPKTLGLMPVADAAYAASTQPNATVPVLGAAINALQTALSALRAETIGR